MSCVTNIVVLAPIQCESFPQDLASRGGFVKVDQHATGPKCMETDVWVGAFNHTHWDDVIRAIGKLDWWNREDVQVMVCEQEDSQYTCRSLPPATAPVPTAGERTWQL